MGPSPQNCLKVGQMTTKQVKKYFLQKHKLVTYTIVGTGKTNLIILFLVKLMHFYNF